MIADVEVAVVGAGPAGLAAACLLAEGGLQVRLFAGERREEADPRTVALMLPSMRLLRHLGLAPAGPALGGSPLARLKIVDDTGRLLTSPPVTFEAQEMGEDAFGWNVPIVSLRDVLLDKAASLGTTVVWRRADRLRLESDRIRVGEAEMPFPARVVIAADGSESRLRAEAGIGTVEWSYDQAAIAASFSHSAPHNDTSIEFHRQAGPLTTVPMRGSRSSLVWMQRPDAAARLMALSEEEFGRQLQADLHGALGLVSDVGPRRCFAMRGLTATRFASGRVLLVGEAAHAGPPIGAQGLNMSLRDAATAAELVLEAVRRGSDPGAPSVMAAYDRRRRIDVAPRQGVIDAVNRSLLSHWELPHAARSLGLMLASRIGPARAMMLRTGVGLGETLPAVMRG